jgi:hypothetical protein
MRLYLLDILSGAVIWKRIAGSVTQSIEGTGVRN